MTKKRDPDLEDFDDEEVDIGAVEEKPKLSHLSYEQLETELAATEEKANQHWENLLRLQAEMENIRRRHEQALTQLISIRWKSLPVNY